MTRKSELPECCQDCTNLESDYDEYSEQSVYYCVRNIWWPIKKQTCRSQKRYGSKMIETLERRKR